MSWKRAVNKNYIKLYVSLFSLFIIVFLPISMNAQVDNKRMEILEDSLRLVGEAMYNLKGEAERIDKNFIFVKTLVSSLKEKNSYDYGFKQLNMISIINSPDDRFRVFSWNIPLNDGSYLYYGAIQVKTNDGSLKLIPLLDKTFEISEPEKELLKNDKWYGAQYVEVLGLSSNSYVLLGWKGHHSTYSQKVIEVLTYDKGNFIFGAKVFENERERTRKIFNYGRGLTMYLKYHKELNSIVFDHIVPVEPEFKDQYQYYGPDLSFDAYELTDGLLRLKSNIVFNSQEPISDMDETKPGRAIPNKKSGL
ncbi:hypothetical protein ORI89_05030 [Sphingobacterium sp. UT-1RO-CII-1]|uniref:hypothetical protein n=1 Tax=Sphingobacterium sp. UT-1RO-CII-1 TaxID=2995225 RepID=UPI00227CD03C|nr:hypothetical protein [Sphingobacterium sp. UT-1RO-CII-1]MCY4779002.1 hypothetical protein [Sphingobacterium sp. UT-1RO-CII-1]